MNAGFDMEIRMVEKLIVLTLLVLLNGCTASSERYRLDYVVFEYEDFGPQAMAYELIGMQVWQWQDFESDPDEEFDIRVVVFEGDRDLFQKKFKTIPAQQLDYRLVRYPDAVQYLNHQIEENIMPAVTERLRRTKTRLEELE